jgi:hypothetical protein
MSILLCVLITWVTLCLSSLGLDLVVLLIVEHFSNTSQVTFDDEGIANRAPQMAKLDGAMDEPVQQARELADAFDALAQLESAVTLAPRDAIPTAHRAVPDRTQRTGAVIIRDPRLTRARTLSDQSGVGLNATFVFPTVCGGRDTAA